MNRHISIRTIWILVLNLFIMATSLPFQSIRAEEKKSLQMQIEKLIQDSRLKNSDLGLLVESATGETIFSLNGEKKFIPASLTKIATAAATLEKLPLGFQLLTTLRTDARIENSVLNGDLCLVGGGDAGFVSESMWFLVNEFLRTRINTITGSIVVDDSRFDEIRFDSSRDQERVDRAYDAPVGAMTFNWSAINVFVRPGDKKGDPALVWADPLNDYIEIENKALTKGSQTKIEVENTGLQKNGKELLRIRGEIPVGANEFVAYKSVVNPGMFAGENLKSFLKQRNIQLQGSVKTGKCPKSAKILATYKSKPVGDLVTGMMKFSNNYIAEILTKNLAAELKGTPGTMDAGVSVIRDYLSEIGLKSSEFTILNPSGLSRKNVFTPQALLKILNRMRNDFRYFPEYATSLPIAGVDGTLRKRKPGDSPEAIVRAKTGHLSGVSGLSGYLGRGSSAPYTFVFIYNGDVDSAYKAKDLFDRILIRLQ